MNTNIFKSYVTVSEAAKLLNRSHSQVTRYIKSGRLHAEKRGSQLFIKRSLLAKFQPPPKGNPAFRQQSEK